MQTTPMRRAATLMILRENRDVLMVERNAAIEFAGGAFVFPGGKIDETDSVEEWREYADFTNQPAQIHAAQIAAIRETFEETGILFAKTAVGEWATNKYASEINLRAQIDKGEASFFEFIKANNLILAASLLAPVAIWTPPIHINKRYMTWFFVAIAPNILAPKIDNYEAVNAIWINPNIALKEALARKRKIVFPTRCNLSFLSNAQTNNEVWNFANSRPPPLINPQIAQINGINSLSIPCDIGYPHWHESLESAQDLEKTIGD